MILENDNMSLLKSIYSQKTNQITTVSTLKRKSL